MLSKPCIQTPISDLSPTHIYIDGIYRLHIVLMFFILNVKGLAIVVNFVTEVECLEGKHKLVFPAIILYLNPLYLLFAIVKIFTLITEIKTL